YSSISSCSGSRIYPTFFVKAEDGMRDRNVTGVQTCALPISNKKQALAACFIDNYILYFFLNLSIRPPARSVLCLPVSKGCVSELISTRITGYSFPSSPTIVSSEVRADPETNLKSDPESRKITV